jgi:hypothetical protein
MVVPSSSVSCTRSNRAVVMFSTRCASGSLAATVTAADDPVATRTTRARVSADHWSQAVEVTIAIVNRVD